MDALTGAMPDTDHREVAGVSLDVGVAGNARIKRVIYPAGFRWSTDMRPIVGTDRCMHSHVGFVAQGRIAGEYDDGCTFEFAAPQVVMIEAGHDAWVTSDEPVVLIEIDAEGDTATRFGLPPEHRHQ